MRLQSDLRLTVLPVVALLLPTSVLHGAGQVIDAWWSASWELGVAAQLLQLLHGQVDA